MEEIIPEEQTSQRRFLAGALQATPIVVGYAAVGIPFGVLASKMGLPLWAAMFMSFLVYAGSAQFIGLQLMAGMSPLPTIYIATFIINLRHFLMGMSLGSQLPRCKKRFLIYLGHSLTDESFGMNISKPKPLHLWNVFGTSTTAHAAWNIATLIGFLIGTQLRFDTKYFEGALPIMFVTLLGLQFKIKKDILMAILAAGLTYLLMSWLPGKWPFLLASLIVPTLGLLLPEENHD